jgi:maleylacetate reductase
MASTFTHVTLPQRVRFGRGLAARNLAEEVGRLGARRVMVVSTGRHEQLAPGLLEGLPVVLRWFDVRQHVPAGHADRARAAAREARADVVVAVGGGSAVGLAKAIALTERLRVVAVPTTYAGSESTDVWGLTEGGVKRTGNDVAVLPVVVVYDPALTDGMPVDLAVASGLNALAHAVDALWAPRADPVNGALAVEGARRLGVGLRAIAGKPAEAGVGPSEEQGRDEALLGAHLAAVAFASAGSGLHHKICHVLGGAYDLPHAATHAVVLPHVLALNAPAVPEAAGRLADALTGRPSAGQGPASAPAALESLRRALGAPDALRDLGMAERDLGDATRRCLEVVPPGNPVEVTGPVMTALLRAAWTGDRRH